MGTVRINETNTGPSTTFQVEGDLISQSASGNYSLVRCYLVAINAGNSSSSYLGAGTQQGTIAGVSTFATKTGDPFLPGGYANGATRWRLGPYDVKVPHDADGTRAPIRFGMVLNYGSISETLFSADMALPTIARASTATLTTPTDLGAAVTINTNRASTAFTHTLELWEYGAGATAPISTIATGVGASHAWTPPLDLATYFPDATSRQFFIRTTTFNGASEVGVTDTVFTLRAPASIVPTVSSITVVDQNPDVASIVGKFVQSLSRAKFTVNGAGIYGSTITGSEVTFQGATIATGSDALVTQSGSLPVTGRVTDSRGRVGSGSATLSVLAYTPPTATAYQARRCNSLGALQDDGAYLRVDLTAGISSLINSTERNALTIRAYTRPHGTTPWTARNVITGGLSYNTWFLMSGGAIYSPTTSYDIRVQVHDKFGVFIADTVVSTAAVALDLNGTSVGIGKIWEQGALDVAGPIYQAGQAVVDVSRTATEAQTGLAELATQAEVDAGTDVARIVTPKRLRDRAYAPYAMAAGQGTTVTTGDVTVTFPAGRFTQPPRVAVTPLFHANVLVPRLATNPTATSFTVSLFRVTEVRIASTFDWTATQMTAGSGSG